MKPRMAITGGLLILSLALGLFLASGRGRQGEYVTREELHREVEAALLPAAQASTQPTPEREALRRKLVDSLVAEAMAAPTPEGRTNAALAAADQATASLRQTLAAIDQARGIVVENIKAANTTGFRALRGRRVIDGKMINEIDCSQGELETTNNPLNVAIQGQGFFKVKLTDTAASGEAYTRNGNFFVNNKSELVVGMGDGYQIEPPIVFPTNATNIGISQDGIIECTKAGQTTKTQLGQVLLCRFANPQLLRRLESGLYAESKESGPSIENKPGEDGAGTLLQGYLENSNVDLIRESLRLRSLQNWRHAIEQAMAAGNGH